MAKPKNELDELRDQVSRLSDQHRQALARLERQASAAPELSFAAVAEALSAMPHVDHVLVQLTSDAHDFPSIPAAGTGTKYQTWKHNMKWRVFIRETRNGLYADRTEATCLAAIKAVLEVIKLPMPAGLEKLAKSIQ